MGSKQVIFHYLIKNYLNTDPCVEVINNDGDNIHSCQVLQVGDDTTHCNKIMGAGSMSRGTSSENDDSGISLCITYNGKFLDN